jgi:hypothetical protein
MPLLHRKWTGYGTSRHFAAAQQFARIWSEADINHRAGFMSTRPTPSTILPSFILWAATASISAPFRWGRPRTGSLRSSGRVSPPTVSLA